MSSGKAGQTEGGGNWVWIIQNYKILCLSVTKAIAVDKQKTMNINRQRLENLNSRNH